MKKRNIVAVVVLHIITFGIYFLYWIYATRKELIAQKGDPKSIPRFIWLFSPLLLLLPLVLVIALTLPTNETQAPDVLALLGIFAAFFAFVIANLAVFFWWFYHYSKVAAAVTKGIDFGPSYVLLIVANLCGIPVVWQALIQNDINKAADRLAAKKPAAA